MKRFLMGAALCAALALPSAAQEKAEKAAEKASEKAPAAMHANPAASGMGAVYKNISGTLVKAAEKMPEEKYSFKPTPEVRSYGQIIAHVADAQNFLCQKSKGVEGTYSDAVEKGKTSKADLIAALKEANAGCESVFAQSDADLAKPTKLFGMDMNRFAAATIVVGHAYEHYGNMVTYLRINGIVPPSSENQGPPPKKDEKKDEKKAEEKK
jgi:uncharacterized damage-inducible protein DinB